MLLLCDLSSFERFDADGDGESPLWGGDFFDELVGPSVVPRNPSMESASWGLRWTFFCFILLF